MARNETTQNEGSSNETPQGTETQFDGHVSFTTTDKTSNRTFSTTFNFGKDLNEAVSLFGKETVMANFVAAAKVDAQAFIRRRLVPGKPAEDGSIKVYSDDEIKSALVEWKPGVSQRSKIDPMTKVSNLLGNLTEEQKQALLQQLAAMTQK